MSWFYRIAFLVLFAEAVAATILVEFAFEQTRAEREKVAEALNALIAAEGVVTEILVDYRTGDVFVRLNGNTENVRYFPKACGQRSYL